MSPLISPKIPTPKKYGPLDMILRGGDIYPMEIDNLETSIFIHKRVKYENLPSFSSIGPLHRMSISI